MSYRLSGWDETSGLKTSSRIKREFHADQIRKSDTLLHFKVKNPNIFTKICLFTCPSVEKRTLIINGCILRDNLFLQKSVLFSNIVLLSGLIPVYGHIECHYSRLITK